MKLFKSKFLALPFGYNTIEGDGWKEYYFHFLCWMLAKEVEF